MRYLRDAELTPESVRQFKPISASDHRRLLMYLIVATASRGNVLGYWVILSGPMPHQEALCDDLLRLHNVSHLLRIETTIS